MTTSFVLKSQVMQGPLTASNIVGIIFFASCSLISMCFFKIAQNLRKILVQWTHTEAFLSTEDYPLPPNTWKLKKKIFFATFFYLACSNLEHFCYLMSEAVTLAYAFQFCKYSETNYVEIFIHRHLKFSFDNISLRYNHFIGFFLEYLNFSYTLYWSFLDLFIILISIGINFLYKKLHFRMVCMKGLLVNEKIWAEIRFHYVKVCELLQFINGQIGAIIIISSFVDGYFILVQLLNITTWVDLFYPFYQRGSLLVT